MVYFEWYRSFLAVYRLGTVSAAARVRCLTQPAVTQHLALLESVVGGKLFARTARGMVPSERGRELYGQIAEAMDAMERVSAELSGQTREGIETTEAPLIRLGMPVEFFREMGLPRFSGLPYRFAIQTGATPQALLTALEEGELDAALLPPPGASAPKGRNGVIAFEPIKDERFLLVGPSDREVIASVDPLEAERRLSEMAWVAYGADLPIIRRFWQQNFGKRPARLRPTLIVADFHALRDAVERGIGVSLLPECVCAESLRVGRIQNLWPEPPAPVRNVLWLAFRRAEQNTPPIRAIIDALKSTSALPVE